MRKYADIMLDSMQGRSTSRDYWTLGRKSINGLVPGTDGINDGAGPNIFFNLKSPDEARVSFYGVDAGRKDRLNRGIRGTASGTVQGRRQVRQAMNDAVEHVTRGGAVNGSVFDIFKNKDLNELPGGRVNWNASYKAKNMGTGAVNKSMFGRKSEFTPDSVAAGMRAVLQRGKGAVVAEPVNWKEFAKYMRSENLDPKDVIMLGSGQGVFDSWWRKPERAGLSKKILGLGTSLRHSVKRVPEMIKRRGLAGTLRRLVKRNKPLALGSAGLGAAGILLHRALRKDK